MPLRMTEDSVGSGIDQGYLRLTNMKRVEPEFIDCLDNSEYPTSLELRSYIQVLADQAAAKGSATAIVDKSGEDYLYAAKFLVAVSLPSVRRAVFERTSSVSTRDCLSQA